MRKTAFLAVLLVVAIVFALATFAAAAQEFGYWKNIDGIQVYEYEPLYPVRLAGAWHEVHYDEATDTAVVGEHLFVPVWPDLPGLGYICDPTTGQYEVYRERLGPDPEKRFMLRWPRGEGYIHLATYGPDGRMYATRKALTAVGVREGVFDLIDEDFNSIIVAGNVFVMLPEEYYQHYRFLLEELEEGVKNGYSIREYKLRDGSILRRFVAN